MKELPNKWCVFADSDNIDIISNFYNTANRKRVIHCYDKDFENNYFVSHNLSGGQSIFTEDPGSHFSLMNLKGFNEFKEITFEQFCKFVLKQPVKLIDYSYLIKYLKKLNIK
jgi:hypothetical protein